MGKNRVLAEQLVERITPRLVALLVELLDEELGGQEEQPTRLPGVSPEGYERTLAMVQRWQTGGRARKGKKAG